MPKICYKKEGDLAGVLPIVFGPDPLDPQVVAVLAEPPVPSHLFHFHQSNDHVDLDDYNHDDDHDDGNDNYIGDDDKLFSHLNVAGKDNPASLELNDIRVQL